MTTVFKKSLYQNADSFRFSKIISEASEPVNIIHFTSSGLLIGCDTSLILYDHVNFEKLSTLYSSKELLKKSYYCAKRNLVFFTNSKGWLYVLNPEKRLLIREIKHDNPNIVSIGFSCSTNTIYVACKDELQLWDLASGNMVITLPFEYELSSFLACGENVYLGFENGSIKKCISNDSVENFLQLEGKSPVTSIFETGDTLCIVQDCTTFFYKNGSFASKLTISHKSLTVTQQYLESLIVQGSLDKSLHFIDVSIYKSIACVKLSSPILTIATDHLRSSIICGLSNGNVVVISNKFSQKAQKSKSFRKIKQLINKFELKEALVSSLVLSDLKILLYTLMCIVRRNRLRESILGIDSSSFFSLFRIFCSNIQQFYLSLGSCAIEFTSLLIERDPSLISDIKKLIKNHVEVHDSFCALQTHILSAFY